MTCPMVTRWQRFNCYSVWTCCLECHSVYWGVALWSRHCCTDRNVRGIFPRIWRRSQVQSHIWRKYFSPYMTENSPRFSLNMTKISILGEIPLKFSLHMTKTLGPGENSPRFSLNMTKISILGENSLKIFLTYDKNIRTRGKITPDFP